MPPSIWNRLFDKFSGLATRTDSQKSCAAFTTSGRVARRPPRPVLPDLVGFDFRPGHPTAYFHVEESSPSWGSQIHLDFAYANTGGPPSGSQTFNIAFYLTTNATINPAGDYGFGRLTGFSVPASGSGAVSSATITLPASNPLSPLTAGPFTIGMLVNSDNTVAESNSGNNDNQGNGKDLTAVAIQPPVAVATDSSGSSSDHAVSFGSIVDDGPGNAQTTQTVTLSDGTSGSLLKVLQNGIHLANGTNFHIQSILSNKLSQPVNVSGGFSLLAANSAETWSIQVSFDPVATGNLSDTLVIQSDDPSNPTINIALSGIGTPQANLAVTSPLSGTVNFGNVATDGPGGAVGNATMTLVNNGSGPLTVNQNGITVGGARSRSPASSAVRRGASIWLTARRQLPPTAPRRGPLACDSTRP